jgi:hypothetical protein
MAKTVLALALGSAAAFSPNAAPRATTIVKSDPNIKTDVGSGWKPESGGFSSTDTPDFFYDDDDERVLTPASKNHRHISLNIHRATSTTRSVLLMASWVVLD